MIQTHTVKCEGCGAPIQGFTNEKTLTCRSCGTKQLLPEIVQKAAPAVKIPQPPRPRVIVSGVNRRDIIIGVLVALVVIGFIAFAVLNSGGYKERNKVSGIVRAHNSPGPRETLMVVSKKGVTEKTADTGYSLNIWVESEKREYEVMVSKEDWDKAKDGDPMSFLRPKSEQH